MEMGVIGCLIGCLTGWLAWLARLACEAACATSVRQAIQPPTDTSRGQGFLLMLGHHACKLACLRHDTSSDWMVRWSIRPAPWRDGRAGANPKPMLLFRQSGVWLLRFAERRLRALLFHEPPRSTRCRTTQG